MNQWYRILRFFFYGSVKGSIQEVQHKLVSLSKAKRIGIVYDATNADAGIAIGKFIGKLNAEGVETETLVYVPNEKTPGKDGVFTGKDVGWNYVPNNASVTTFCSKQFDILLALFPHETLPLEYVVLTSKAICRVGLYHPQKTSCFELMVKPANEQAMGDIITQTETLLNKVK